MKSVLLLALCGIVAASGMLSQVAGAIEPFKKEFDLKYVKKDSTDPADQKFAAAVATAKCNVCHVGTSKKARNEYGKALDELLDKKTDKADSAKIQAALEKVAGMKSNPKDPNSPTFGDLFKKGELPPSDAAQAAK